MAVVVERLLTGGAVFALPGSRLEVLWIGPGSENLFIGSPRVPGGLTTRIVPVSVDGVTLRAASEAVDRFVALCDEEGS